jgi:hypothetical protein
VRATLTVPPAAAAAVAQPTLATVRPHVETAAFATASARVCIRSANVFATRVISVVIVDASLRRRCSSCTSNWPDSDSGRAILSTGRSARRTAPPTRARAARASASGRGRSRSGASPVDDGAADDLRAAAEDAVGEVALVAAISSMICAGIRVTGRVSVSTVMVVPLIVGPSSGFATGSCAIAFLLSLGPRRGRSRRGPRCRRRCGIA